MGLYSKISIVAPDSAQAGEVVDVEAVVENTSTTPEPHTIYVIPVLRIDGIVISGREETITPENGMGTRSWFFQFTMPNKSVTINAESWCESYYVEWHLDDTDQKYVRLEEAPPEYKGTLSRKEFEYDETRAEIPVY